MISFKMINVQSQTVRRCRDGCHAHDHGTQHTCTSQAQGAAQYQSCFSNILEKQQRTFRSTYHVKYRDSVDLNSLQHYLLRMLRRRSYFDDHSELDVSRRCAVRIYILLTYLLTYLFTDVRRWRHSSAVHPVQTADGRREESRPRQSTGADEIHADQRIPNYRVRRQLQLTTEVVRAIT